MTSSLDNSTQDDSTPDNEESNAARGPRRRWMRSAIRWGVTLVVLAAVFYFAGDSLRKGWNQLSTADVSIAWSWVALSAVLYAVGLLPQALYWQTVLRSLGQRAPLLVVLRGYYLGHLGKYVPGKALVAVLRTGALVAAGCSGRVTVVAVFLETLTFMATGAMIAALLLVASGHGSWHFVWLSIGLAALVGLPITPPIARIMSRRVIARRDPAARQSADVLLKKLTWRLTALGLLCGVLAWTTMGLSLWAAVVAVGTLNEGPLPHLALWIEAATLPVVAGFLSLIPGGLFVRDALQVDLLAPLLSAEMALVVAGLWRLVSIATEVVVCVILEVAHRIRPHVPPADTP